MSFKKILVAVDGSAHSMKATEEAMELAKLAGSQIILLHCHRPFPAMLGEPYFQHAQDKIRKEALDLLLPFKELLEKNSLDYTALILEDHAAPAIVRTSEAEGCDLIIMGSRGLTDLQGLLLGSITHRVLHSASCPVLVVK